MTNPPHSIDYRPDIDGLRAIAVLLVILFHADLLFPGGFIGVDIFFVISGYLITAQILTHIASNSFSFIDFFSRRICRLLPALQVMVLFTLFLGYFLQLPTSYKELANSACYQQILSANFFFWKNTGYFNGDAELKPLLHTWSLAVEEQFYIFFPILLILTRIFLRNYTTVTLFLLTVLSLLLSEYASHHHRSAAFFLLPTRSWELMLGSLTLFLPENKANYSRTKKLLSFLSLCSIFAVSLTYNKTTTFPGLHAVIPCFATATIIYLGNHNQHSFALLRSRMIVTIGLMSYSLYLWHWPIFAFTRELLGVNLDTWLRVSLVLLAMPVAFLSWKYIEQPFRTLKNKSFYARYLLLTTPLVYGLAFFVDKSNGIPNRVPDRFTRYQAASQSIAFIHETTPEQADRGEFPVYGKPNSQRKCVLWGDSHAMSLMPGLDYAGKSMNVTIIQATHSSTPPLFDFIDIYETGLNEETPRFANAVLAYCIANKVEMVILAGAWYSYARNARFEQQLRETIAVLEKENIMVIFVYDIPIQDRGPLEFATRAWWKMPIDFSIPREKHLNTNAKVLQTIPKCVSTKTTIIDPSVSFAFGQRFTGEGNGKIYYRDNQHLSIDGGLLLGPVFKEIFRSKK